MENIPKMRMTVIGRYTYKSIKDAINYFYQETRNGKSVEEIAKNLGVSVATLKAWTKDGSESNKRFREDGIEKWFKFKTKNFNKLRGGSKEKA